MVSGELETYPALVCIAWVRKVETEHAEHIEHIKEENGGELPEVPVYDYLHKREKPFPWGFNTLFFNPHVSTHSPFSSFCSHCLCRLTRI